MTYRIYVDGASRGNGVDNEPGHGAAGVLIYKGNELIGQFARALGRVDNNQAEYEAVFLGLIMAWSADLPNPIIFSDSRVVVNQVNGDWPCESQNLLPILHSVLEIKDVYDFTLTHVSRAHVAIADDLANKILDETLNPKQPRRVNRKGRK